jgi:hypothetical protein
MADIDLKTLTPDTSLPTTGFLFGADSQATASPSVYAVTTAITAILGNAASSDVLAFNSDTIVLRDAANILAQRNGVTAQAFRVYKTYTDGSNYERGVFDFKTTANVLTIGTEKLGTGATRNIQFLVGGVLKADFGVTGSSWTFVGNIQSPNSIQVTFDISVGRNLSLGPNPYTGGSTVTIYSDTSGVLQLSSGITASSGNFNRLTFGGATSSFPSIKRSTTFLQARLADDSAACGFSAANVQAATAYTVATLPGTPGTGMIARVSDSLAPAIGTTVAAGGAAYALVNYNGANWTVIGI